MNSKGRDKNFRKTQIQLNLRSSRRLQVVVEYENQPTGDLFREEFTTHLHFGGKFIACTF